MDGNLHEPHTLALKLMLGSQLTPPGNFYPSRFEGKQAYSIHFCSQMLAEVFGETQGPIVFQHNKCPGLTFSKAELPLILVSDVHYRELGRFITVQQNTGICDKVCDWAPSVAPQLC